MTTNLWAKICPKCHQPFSHYERRRTGSNTYVYAVHYVPEEGKVKRKKCYISPMVTYLYVTNRYPVLALDDIKYIEKCFDLITDTLDDIHTKYQEALEKIESSDEPTEIKAVKRARLTELITTRLKELKTLLANYQH